MKNSIGLVIWFMGGAVGGAGQQYYPTRRRIIRDGSVSGM
jgi:hypothetical protein